jgi:hypothetical protein
MHQAPFFRNERLEDTEVLAAFSHIRFSFA